MSVSSELKRVKEVVQQTSRLTAAREEATQCGATCSPATTTFSQQLVMTKTTGGDWPATKFRSWCDEGNEQARMRTDHFFMGRSGALQHLILWLYYTTNALSGVL